jgi:hypothetical protein
MVIVVELDAQIIIIFFSIFKFCKGFIKFGDMKNLFKQKGIFICKHDVHQDFSSQMSVYHILEEKQCFPDGCVYFKWKCKILAKRKKCHRNFSTVGRKCFSCKYFYEEKIHQFPQMHIESKEKFMDDYAEYREWIKTLQSGRVLCEGKVDSIRPDLMVNKYNGKFQLKIRGFLISFEEGFIQNMLFEDQFFLHISTTLQNKLKIRKNDEVEFFADLKVTQGRLEFYHPNKINFYLRGSHKPMNKGDALVSMASATIFPNQPEKCKGCIYSILPDIEGIKFGRKRALICTKGINDFNYCVVFSEKTPGCEKESCANSDLSCNKTL